MDMKVLLSNSMPEVIFLLIWLINEIIALKEAGKDVADDTLDALFEIADTQKVRIIPIEIYYI